MGVRVIGLAGGIASGKSTVAALFAEWGAHVFDADRLAHAVLAENHVRRRLAERWGERVLAPSGEIDRAAVAERVFAEGEQGRKERRFLEDVIHPPIRQRIMAELERLGRDPELAVVVIDAPLLVEAGWVDLCDEVVWVETPLEERLQRAALRGWPPEQFYAREACQLPIDQKRAVATHVLHNAGASGDLRRQARGFWESRIALWGGDRAVPDARPPADC